VDRLTMPDTFTLVFRDPDRDILGKAGLEIGKKVKISTASTTGDDPEPLITGEVTSIEAEYDTLGTRAVVRGYDKSHRLAAGRKTATYQNVKYSDIAQQIAGGAGLQADCDTSDGTYEHVFQVNMSDLDFLYGLACCSRSLPSPPGRRARATWTAPTRSSSSGAATCWSSAPG
jgi:hypothetical protein